MKNNNLFSIIVPVYNSEKYLSDCIISLIEQTYKNIEIILVNDGSNDSSDLVCKMFKDKDNRIKYIKKTNGGVSSARNTGLNEAKGDYIMFVDSDDLLKNDCVEILNDYFISYNLDIIKFSYTKFLNNYKKEYKYTCTTNQVLHNDNYKNTIFPYVFKTNDLCNICNAAFKKETINELNFDENILVGEDFLFMINALIKSNSIMFINESLYFYRLNFESATQQYDFEKNVKKYTSEVTAFRLINKLLNDNNYSIDLKNNTKYNDATSHYLNQSAGKLNYRDYRKILRIIDDNNYGDFQLKKSLRINIKIPIISYLYQKFRFVTLCILKKVVLNKRRKNES